MNYDHFHTQCRKRREMERMEKAQQEVCAECNRMREEYKMREDRNEQS